MFVLPLDRGIDWRDPPMATLILAALSVVGFFMFQLDDRQAAAQARAYYFDSGLAAIELPAYKDWLANQGRAQEIADLNQENSAAARHRLYHRQFRDARFQDALAEGEVITRDHEAYQDWRAKREAYQDRLAGYTAFQWGLVTSRVDWPNLVSHQFLHGGFMHLLGNMVFLVAAGLLVEAVAGAAVTATVYVVGGLGAAFAFIWINPGANGPLVGASGSLSAVMGALAVAYGLQRVRVFIYLGFYMDSRRVPAVLLLIPWIGLQVLLMELNGDQSNIAYSAHIGGYLAGAALMVPVRLMDSGIAERARPPETSSQPVDELLAGADQALTRMDVEDARRGYEQVLEEQPGNRQALRGLYYCHRLQPSSEAYHDTAHRILGLRDPQATGLMREVYHDYRGRAKPKPRLSADILANLAARFINDRSLEEADQLLTIMHRKPSAFPKLPAQAAELARLWRESGREERATAWADVAKQLKASSGQGE